MEGVSKGRRVKSLESVTSSVHMAKPPCSVCENKDLYKKQKVVQGTKKEVCTCCKRRLVCELGGV